jgi:NAD(P)-dependent dehydrogenase (short-subunit alcohol dehydrogenase family)
MRTATLLPTAVVAGASSAIGAAIAFRLARLGYDVCINCRDSADRARGVVDQIETAEGRAIALRADVRDFDAIQRRIDQTATASVGAFSRLWLGVRSATSLSWTDEFSGSPDLLAKLDHILCLPSPASDWDY